MQLTVDKLKEAIADYERKVAQDKIDWAAKVEKSKVAFYAKYGTAADKVDEWKEYRSKLTAELRKANPKPGSIQQPFQFRKFRVGAMHRQWRNGGKDVVRWSEADHSWGPPPELDPEILALKAFLVTVEDKVIASNQLASAGFRNMKNLFGQMGLQ